MLTHLLVFSYVSKTQHNADSTKFSCIHRKDPEAEFFRRGGQCKILKPKTRSLTLIYFTHLRKGQRSQSTTEIESRIFYDLP